MFPPHPIANIRGARPVLRGSLGARELVVIVSFRFGHLGLTVYDRCVFVSRKHLIGHWANNIPLIVLLFPGEIAPGLALCSEGLFQTQHQPLPLIVPIYNAQLKRSNTHVDQGLK